LFLTQGKDYRQVRTEETGQEKNTHGRIITLQLSEHDALQILALVRKELNRSDKIWKPYWEAQVKKIQQFIEQASRVQRPSWSDDVYSLDEPDNDLIGPLKLSSPL
jgi:hypothetical protein